MKKRLKELKQGEYFQLKEREYPTEHQVFIRGEYDRSSNNYYVYRFDDVSYCVLRRGDLEVYVDFIF